MRFFNTGGPCNPEDHYMLSARAWLEAYDVERMIRQKQYFVLHAPRRIGKTTAMHEPADQLTNSGEYIALVLSLETGAAYPNDPLKAEQAILGSWKITITTHLNEWALAAPRPLVIFWDEIDALQNDMLISVLRQLCSGYYNRPKGFPASLALIGLRDVRDYKFASGGSQRLGTPSPSNIAVRSITLRNFTVDKVKTLLTQHVDETGQIIPRVLAISAQAGIPRIALTWLNADGSLNPQQLVDAFLAFRRQHGEPLLRSAPYHEIAPHLVLMAFLHRVVNGIVDREYAIGSGKMDLYLRHDGDDAAVQMAMELKVWRTGRPDPPAEGLQQLEDYMQGLT